MCLLSMCDTQLCLFLLTLSETEKNKVEKRFLKPNDMYDGSQRRMGTMVVILCQLCSFIWVTPWNPEKHKYFGGNWLYLWFWGWILGLNPSLTAEPYPWNTYWKVIGWFHLGQWLMKRLAEQPLGDKLTLYWENVQRWFSSSQ